MSMNRAQKDTEVKALHEQFSNEEIVVVAHYSGLTVSQLSQLRSDLRKEGGTFKVTKNTLAKLALKGTKFEGLSDLFTGPTGIATSKDPVVAAKIAHQFAKKNDKLVIVGGGLGTLVLDAASVERLAKLPSLDQLRAKLLGLIQGPATKLAGVLQAPARDLVGVTKAYGEKGN